MGTFRFTEPKGIKYDIDNNVVTAVHYHHCPLLNRTVHLLTVNNKADFQSNYSAARYGLVAVFSRVRLKTFCCL